MGGGGEFAQTSAQTMVTKLEGSVIEKLKQGKSKILISWAFMERKYCMECLHLTIKKNYLGIQQPWYNRHLSRMRAEYSQSLGPDPGSVYWIRIWFNRILFGIYEQSVHITINKQLDGITDGQSHQSTINVFCLSH